MDIENDICLEERRNKMVDYINEKGKVSTKELGDLFHSSTVTIRNDINQLDEMGLIVKVHGGALACYNFINREIPASIKYQKDTGKKQIIGKLGATLLNDNEIVILDSGSSVLEVAKAVSAKNVTIITNDIKTAYCLADNSNVKLIVVGGTREPNLYTLTGMETLRMYEIFHVDKLFLGCDALDFKEGVTNRSLDEVAIKKAMIAAAEKVIAIADSSKLDKRVFASVCGLSEIDTIVTDAIGAEDLEVARQLGIEVLTPPADEVSR